MEKPQLTFPLPAPRFAAPSIAPTPRKSNWQKGQVFFPRVLSYLALSRANCLVPRWQIAVLFRAAACLAPSACPAAFTGPPKSYFRSWQHPPIPVLTSTNGTGAHLHLCLSLLFTFRLAPPSLLSWAPGPTSRPRGKRCSRSVNKQVLLFILKSGIVEKTSSEGQENNELSKVLFKADLGILTTFYHQAVLICCCFKNKMFLSEVVFFLKRFYILSYIVNHFEACLL